MPLRTYSGKGACHLPGFLHLWLMDARPDTLTVTDVGVLATILFAAADGYGASPEAGWR
jgi:hypothetical protein